MTTKTREQPGVGLDVAALKTAFSTLRAVLPSSRKSPSPKAIAAGLSALGEPLSAAREQGGVINPWAVAGLRRDETRVASALAGLWRKEFGGNASISFLAAFLQEARADFNWKDDLAQGYRLMTEVCPLGERRDRVDLVVETRTCVVGIEIKIDAGLGPKQTERYLESVRQRAAMSGREALVMLLAPFSCDTTGVIASSWQRLAEAAREASHATDRAALASQLIAKFGDYVEAF